jgi:PilZ domain
MDVGRLETQCMLSDGAEHLRSAVRFPLALPVQLVAGEKLYQAVTDNISANGVLLRLSELLMPGTTVDFLIEIPEGVIAPDESAAVHCSGRVVRSYGIPSMTYAAAVIDEYSFQ